MVHKKLPHRLTELSVFTAPDHTQCVHESSRKLKLPKNIHTNKVQTGPTLPPPENATMHNS